MWGRTWGDDFEPTLKKSDAHVAIRNPQGIHRLSAAAIKYITEAGRHADGDRIPYSRIVNDREQRHKHLIQPRIDGETITLKSRIP